MPKTYGRGRKNDHNGSTVGVLGLDCHRLTVVYDNEAKWCKSRVLVILESETHGKLTRRTANAGLDHPSK